MPEGLLVKWRSCASYQPASRFWVADFGGRRLMNQSVRAFAGEHRLRNRARHFIFEDGRVIWIWLRSSSSGKSQSLVETNRGFVIACDHQKQGPGVASMRPAENLLHQSPAYALLTVSRGCPHRDKLCSRGIVLVQK
jgi:hypothetical protein